jgi:hypothetical protein
MRTKGTKYDSIEQLPAEALPVSAFVKKYSKRFNVSSSAYAHIKYDRFRFGYETSKGEKKHTAHPGYDIIDFKGTCYIINYQ